MDTPASYIINVGDHDTFSLASGTFALKCLTPGSNRARDLLYRAGRIPFTRLDMIRNYVERIYDGVLPGMRLPLISLVATVYKSLHLGASYLDRLVNDIVSLHLEYSDHGPVFGTMAELAINREWLEDIKNKSIPPSILTSGINILVVSDDGVEASLSRYSQGTIFAEEALLLLKGSFQSQHFPFAMLATQGLLLERDEENQLEDNEMFTFITSIPSDDLRLAVNALSPKLQKHHPGVAAEKVAYGVEDLTDSVLSFQFNHGTGETDSKAVPIIFNLAIMQSGVNDEGSFHCVIGEPAVLIQRIITDQYAQLISISHQAQPSKDILIPEIQMRTYTCGYIYPGVLKSIIHYIFVCDAIQKSRIERYISSLDIASGGMKCDENMFRPDKLYYDILPFLMALIRFSLGLDVSDFEAEGIVLKPISQNDARALVVYLLTFRSISRQLQTIILGSGTESLKSSYRRKARDVMAHIISYDFENGISMAFAQGRASFRALFDEDASFKDVSLRQKTCLDIAMSFRIFNQDYNLLTTA
jgi:hypothetical protein